MNESQMWFYFLKQFRKEKIIKDYGKIHYYENQKVDLLLCMKVSQLTRKIQNNFMKSGRKKKEERRK